MLLLTADIFWMHR